MRNCLFVVLLAGLISACTSSGKPDNIVVTFDVKNPTATEVVLVYHRTIGINASRSYDQCLSFI